MKALVFSILIIQLSACTFVNRRLQKQEPYDNYASSYAEEASDTTMTVDQETYRSLSVEEREQLEDKLLLSRLENALRTTDEKRHYQRFKNTLESDRERIEFLSLDGITARDRYLQSRGFTSSPRRHARDIASLIEDSDIAIGMGRQAVRESWGDPVNVDVAGRGDSGNERWWYTDYVSTPEGYQRENRVLYFENGKLVGWEKF